MPRSDFQNRITKDHREGAGWQKAASPASGEEPALLSESRLLGFPPDLGGDGGAEESVLVLALVFIAPWP